MARVMAVLPVWAARRIAGRTTKDLYEEAFEARPAEVVAGIAAWSAAAGSIALLDCSLRG